MAPFILRAVVGHLACSALICTAGSAAATAIVDDERPPRPMARVNTAVLGQEKSKPGTAEEKATASGSSNRRAMQLDGGNATCSLPNFHKMQSQACTYRAWAISCSR